MADEQSYDPTLPLREVIISLLRISLPEALLPMLEFIADEALRSNRYIAPYADARWGALSENEGSLVEREVGLIAREVMREALQRVVQGGGTQLH